MISTVRGFLGSEMERNNPRYLQLMQNSANGADSMAQYAQQADSDLLNSAMQFQQQQTQQAQNSMQEAAQQQAKQDAQKRQLLSLGLMFATGGASGGAEGAESVAKGAENAVEGAKAVDDASQLASEAGAMSHSMWDKFLNGANSVGKFAWQNTPYYQLGQAFNGRR